MNTQERIDEVMERIHGIARWMGVGTDYENVWQHSTYKLRWMNRRLKVLILGLELLKNEVYQNQQAA